MPTVHYNLSTFLLHTPPDLLRVYLGRRGLLADVGFEGLKRRAAARVVAAAIAELPEADRTAVEADFRNLNLAARSGAGALCDALGVRGLAAEADHLAGLDGDYARAFRLLLDHPDSAFNDVLHFAQARTLPAGRFHRRTGLPTVAPETSSEALDALASRLREHFRRERRGFRFEVTHSQRRSPTRHWFVGIGDDHQQSAMEFDDHGLTCIPRRPAFEVAYMWHPDDGVLEVAAAGDRRDIDELADVFRRAVLPGVTSTGNGRCLAINPLLDPAFAYPTDPQDQIAHIEPVKFCFTDGRRGSASLDMRPALGERLHDFTSRIVDLDRVQREGLSLYSARLRAVWRPEARHGRTTTFTLTMPDATDLDDAPKNQVLRGYLRRWGLAA